jgi:hypothetical protein
MTRYGSFASGAVLTAAQLNGAWTDFTPTWTNVTLGTGSSQTWAYIYVPGGMWISGGTSLGTGGSFTGAISMTLPNSETTRASRPGFNIGMAFFVDASGADSFGNVTCSASDTTLSFYTQAGSLINATTPFTWTTSDVLRATMMVPL